MTSYKLIVNNAKVILKTMANYVINLTGIKDNLTGTGNITNNKIDWTLQEYTNTAANFTSLNPVLLLGQKGIETDDLLTAPKFKIGNGVTAWNSLPYAGGSSTPPTWQEVTDAGATTTTPITITQLQTDNANLTVTDAMLEVLDAASTANLFKVDRSDDTVKYNGVEVATVNDLDAKQDKQIIASATAQTAVNDGDYIVNATTTFTDPSPVEAKGFSVIVRNGTATVGGTAYSVEGTIIKRIFHSGAWKNYATYTSNVLKSQNDFRLTLTSGVPVTTSDVVNASTIYFSPYKGNVISLYNGTNWLSYESNEISLALGALATGVYDVFCYANAGVPTLEFLAWTNTTTKATAIVKQNGVDVKSGDATRRWVGTFNNRGNKTSTVTISNASPAVINWNSHNLPANAPIVFTSTGTLPSGLVAGNTYYLASLGYADANTFNVSATPGGAVIATTTAGSGTHTATVSAYTEDSEACRFLENAENQVLRRMWRADLTTSWNYNGVVRQSRANKLNQLNFVNGRENLIQAKANQRASASLIDTVMSLSISLDAIAQENGATTYFPQYRAGLVNPLQANFDKQVGIGEHYLALCENSGAATTTWNGGSDFRSQILGYKPA